MTSPAKLDFPPLHLLVTSIHTHIGKIIVYLSLANRGDDPFASTFYPLQLEIPNDELDQYPNFKVGEHYVFRRSIEVDDR